MACVVFSKLSLPVELHLYCPRSSISSEKPPNPYIHKRKAIHAKHLSIFLCVARVYLPHPLSSQMRKPPHLSLSCSLHIITKHRPGTSYPTQETTFCSWILKIIHYTQCLPCLTPCRCLHGLKHGDTGLYNVELTSHFSTNGTAPATVRSMVRMGIRIAQGL